MSSPILSSKQFVRVICEPCQQKIDPNCEICGGSKFYFWDSETLLCYSAEGTPLVAENNNGEVVGLTRPSTKLSKDMDLATMLRFIELWISEKPARKWKLSIEKGWSCSIWPNRYKDKAQVFVSDDPEGCVTDCYKFVMMLIANPAD